MESARTFIQKCPLGFYYGSQMLPVDFVNVSAAHRMAPIGSLPADTVSLPVPPAGRFFWDTDSGYLLDPKTGLYYDPNTRCYMTRLPTGQSLYFGHDLQENKLVKFDTPSSFGGDSATPGSICLSAMEAKAEDTARRESEETKARQATKIHAVESVLAAAQMAAEESKKAKKEMPTPGQGNNNDREVAGGDSTSGDVTLTHLGGEDDDEDESGTERVGGGGISSAAVNHGISKANKYKTQAIFGAAAGGGKTNKGGGPLMAHRSGELTGQRPDKRQKMMQQWHSAQAGDGGDEFSFPADDDDDEVGSEVSKALQTKVDKEYLCFVCLRQFNSGPHLALHEAESRLHKVGRMCGYVDRSVVCWLVAMMLYRRPSTSTTWEPSLRSVLSMPTHSPHSFLQCIQCCGS
eukprot:GHVN01012264.1.p2 GENE.GHVN01012264.1~~GHVN01012264.1.p2  ORF type:complete len:405 (+),score=74.82 GHVN01012264.1:800-2014(+)